MAAGVTDKLWSVADMGRVIEDWEVRFAPSLQIGLLDESDLASGNRARPAVVRRGGRTHPNLMGNRNLPALPQG